MTAKCNYQGPERRDSCHHADQAAEKAVEKTFAILGVNINEPKEVREFQESLRFGDFLRKAANKGLFTLVTTLIGALMITLWYGFKQLIGSDT